MIIVKMHNQDVKVDADTWECDGDGDLDCTKEDNVVATFPRGYWCAVYEEGSVTKIPTTASMPFPVHPAT